MSDFETNVIKWADERGIIDGSTTFKQLTKLSEEVIELAMGLSRQDRAEIADAIGDCSVVLAILAKQCGLSLTYCQQLAWEEIKDRKGKMVNGIFVKEA